MKPEKSKWAVRIVVEREGERVPCSNVLTKASDYISAIADTAKLLEVDSSEIVDVVAVRLEE